MEIAKIRLKVSFCQIIDYLGNRKRCLIEGKGVSKAGYMVGCGIKEEKPGMSWSMPFVFRYAVYEENHMKWRHMSRKMNLMYLAAVKQARLATVSTALLCFSTCTMSIFLFTPAKSMT